MNKIYPKLYAKSSTGKTLIWFMTQNGGSYFTTSGQIDGKLVESEPTVAEAKNVGKANETSPEEQAEFEISAKYAKQQKSGGYFSDIKDIDKDRFVQPMLAKGFLDRLNKIKYPVIVDKKYNGGRCIGTGEGLKSRKGERLVSTPHIWESIYPLFEEYPNLVTDGELYNHDYRFNLNEIMKLIRKTVHVTPEDIKESRAKIKYYVYDAYGFENVTAGTKQFERRAALKDLLKGFEFIEVVEGKLADNEQEVFKHYGEYLEDGYEGAIVRLNGSYENKRSSQLLKIKPEDSDEAIIIDILEGEGNWANTGKIITLKWKDKVFNATFKGNFEQAAQFLKDKDKWIGKEVQFIYNGLTGLKIPNFARMDINNNTNLK